MIKDHDNDKDNILDIGFSMTKYMVVSINRGSSKWLVYRKIPLGFIGKPTISGASIGFVTLW